MQPRRTSTVERRGRVAVAGSVAAVLVALLLGLPPTLVRPAAAADTAPAVGVLALRDGDAAATPALSGSPGDLGYVVLQAWEHGRIAAIKAASPGVRVLVYKDASATVEYAATTDAAGNQGDNALLPAGVGYYWARANAPSWFLTDAGGQPVEWADYPGVWPMDVGNPAYQRAWLDNVLSEVRTNGWDGVMLDDTVSYLSHPTVGDVVGTQIPTDAAQLEAMSSFLATVGPGLTSAGFLAVPNVTLSWQNWRAVLDRWSPHVSGWLLEYFIKWGLTSDYPRMGGDDWASRLEIVERAQELGRFVLAVTYGSAADTDLQAYHRASWLLAWDGRGGASVYVPSETATPHVMSAAMTDVGAPRGRRYAVRGGAVWRRDFTAGTALVNPGLTRQIVDLGDSFRDAAGRRVGRVILPPVSGAVLTSDAVLGGGAGPGDPSAAARNARISGPLAAAVRLGKAVKVGRPGTSWQSHRLSRSDPRVGCAAPALRC